MGCTCLPRSSLTERSWVLPPCTFLFSDRESPEWNSYSLSGTVTSLFPFLTMHMEAKCSPVPPRLAEWSTQTLQPVNQSLFSNLCPRQNISVTIIVDHSLSYSSLLVSMRDQTQHPLKVPKFISKSTISISPVAFGCSSFLALAFVRNWRELVWGYSS